MESELSDFEDDDYETNEDGLEELESRVDALEHSAAQWRGAATSGYGLGSLLAAILSWDKNQAVGWCLIHAVLSWLYVIYRLIFDWDRLKIL